MKKLIRSFIAVPLNPQVHKSLADFTRQYSLNSREQGFRPVKAENIHLTFKFLGEIDENQVQQLGFALSQLTVKLSPFTGSVQGIGAFPGWTNRPRVIWVGVEPVEPIRDVYHLIEEATIKLGIAADGKPFSPHLTLARVSYLTRESESAINKLKDLSPEPDFGRFLIDKVTLYKSVLLPQGPVYSILSSHPFSA